LHPEQSGLIHQPSSCVDDNFHLNVGRFVRAIADEKKGAAECWFTGHIFPVGCPEYL
jgi:hypothetical protein